MQSREFSRRVGTGAPRALHLGSKLLVSVFCKHAPRHGRMVAGLWWEQGERPLPSSRRLEVGPAGLVASRAFEERGPGECPVVGVLTGAVSSSCLVTRDVSSAAGWCFCLPKTKPGAACSLPPGPHLCHREQGQEHRVADRGRQASSPSLLLALQPCFACSRF